MNARLSLGGPESNRAMLAVSCSTSFAWAGCVRLGVMVGKYGHRTANGKYGHWTTILDPGQQLLDNELDNNSGELLGKPGAPDNNAWKWSKACRFDHDDASY